jgi:hypothetical protein
VCVCVISLAHCALLNGVKAFNEYEISWKIEILAAAIESIAR